MTNDTTIPPDAAALQALAQPLLEQAVNREAALHARYDAIRATAPFADEHRILTALTQEAVTADDNLRTDLLAAERTCDAVLAALEGDAARARTVPSAVDAVWGSAGESAATLHQARLLDLAEAAHVRDWLGRTRVADVAARIAQADDVKDGPWLHAVEHELLVAGWTTSNPDDATALHTLKQQLKQRQDARVPADLRASLDATRQLRSKVSMWRGVLAALPAMSETVLQDVLRRRQRDAVRG